MAVTMYKFRCEICAKDFERPRRAAVACGRVCAGVIASRSACTQICECGAPASKRGWCVDCSAKRKLASRLRARQKHEKRWAEERRQRHAGSVEFREKARRRSDKNRFNGRRDAVLERDGHKCRSCGSAENLVVHHEKRRTLGIRTDGHSQLDDLTTLCRSCHINLHRSAGDLASTMIAP